ncbi:MAG TPA: ester cyclase [Ktedonobacteraceae bacterium]|nr:ester cyclase [Ktedonobacteraceae bacterium]
MQEEHSIPELVDNLRAGKMPRRQFIQTLTGIGLSAAGITAIVAAAAKQFQHNSSAHMVDQESPAKHIEHHERHLQYQASGNSGALQNDYAEHAIVEDSMHDRPFVGRAAIMARKNVGFAATSDFKIDVHKRVVRGNEVIVEWTASGKHTGDLPGMPATGRDFSIHGVTVVVREHGKIVRESLFYDVAEFRRQVKL